MSAINGYGVMLTPKLFFVIPEYQKENYLEWYDEYCKLEIEVNEKIIRLIENYLREKDSSTFLKLGCIYNDISGEMTYYLYFPAKMYWQMSESEKLLTKENMEDEIFNALSDVYAIALNKAGLKDSIILLNCGDN